MNRNDHRTRIPDCISLRLLGVDKAVSTRQLLFDLPWEFAPVKVARNVRMVAIDRYIVFEQIKGKKAILFDRRCRDASLVEDEEKR